VHKTNDKYGVNFSTEWDTSIKSQRWSCYQMYNSNTGGGAGRYDSYANGYPHDEDMPKAYLLPGDPYRGSGYQHGHICPSADRQYSKEANRQTFFLSNMQPQLKEFNEVDYIWERMEKQVRSWNVGKFRDTLYVCKGGTIDGGRTIGFIGSGANRIPVPKYFFMAVLCKNSQGYKAIGLYVEHKRYGKKEAVADYVVNIRQLETLTDIDFFCNLPDNIENQVETLDIDNTKRTWGL